MVMRRNIILTFVASLVCATSFAQSNLNPTVEVTNTYQGDPSAVHKPQIGMAIPDSLLRFDMDFGYEVFEKPYQGAYNFKPYMLAMKPEKNAFRGRKLYLRAGAGYSLHPQLDFVFSPEPKGPFLSFSVSRICAFVPIFTALLKSLYVYTSARESVSILFPYCAFFVFLLII